MIEKRPIFIRIADSNYNERCLRKILETKISNLSLIHIYARKQWGAKALTAYVVGENMASRRSLERSGFFLQEKIPVADLPSGLYRYRLEWGKEKGNVL